jgi:hypothetical protein
MSRPPPECPEPGSAPHGACCSTSTPCHGLPRKWLLTALRDRPISPFRPLLARAHGRFRLLSAGTPSRTHGSGTAPSKTKNFYVKLRAPVLPAVQRCAGCTGTTTELMGKSAGRPGTCSTGIPREPGAGFPVLPDNVRPPRCGLDNHSHTHACIRSLPCVPCVPVPCPVSRLLRRLACPLPWLPGSCATNTRCAGLHSLSV